MNLCAKYGNMLIALHNSKQNTFFPLKISETAQDVFKDINSVIENRAKSKNDNHDYS